MRGVHWFRNDLRLRDNSTIEALAEQVDEWLPVFVIDDDILADRPGLPRVRFLRDCVERLAGELERRAIPFALLSGRPEERIPALMEASGAEILSHGVSVTPMGTGRDERVRRAVERAGGRVLTQRDHTVFSPHEIRTRSGDAYSVFTPFRNRWWAEWEKTPRLASRRSRLPRRSFPAPRGFRRAARFPTARPEGALALPSGGERAAQRRLRRFLGGPIERYAVDRDRPDRDGTSRLSPYLRFGAISVRDCMTQALAAAEREPSLRPGVSKWLDELIWREFYDAVLCDAPRVLGESYRREYDALPWRDDDEAFAAWREGRTGFPFVDAGMRQLRETGWMHNRVRMIVASFLTKDLLIDWRRGARYFFEALVDGDPASNNGGWQWAASTGTDAQPFFRVFNPTAQGRKWDPDGRYVRRYVPELESVEDRFVHEPSRAPDPPDAYPAPIVDHALARERALEAYRRVKGKRG